MATALPALVLLILASAVLVLEFGMTAAAGLAGYQGGLDRFTALTGLTPSRAVYRGLGLLALLGVICVILGFWKPPLALPGAAYFALLSAFTLTRQLQRGQRGRELLAYTLFLACALLVIALRLAGLLEAAG